MSPTDPTIESRRAALLRPRSAQPEPLPPSETPPPPPPPQPPAAKPRRALRFGPAFWTVASVLSLVVNIILIGVLLVVGSQLFTLKRLLRDNLIGGLYNNFVLMDQASIRTTIPVKTEVPARFNLPLETDTTVRLTQDTRITAATVTLNTGGLTIINAPTDIILPAGTDLPIHLKLEVPVDQKIPVELMVDVNIPLNQTELHEPFVGLQQVVLPYYTLLNGTPDSWAQAFCGPKPNALCRLLFR